MAGLLGQAFVVAYNTIRHNKDGTEHVADVLVAKREIYGDDVVALLDEAGSSKPEIDVLDEDVMAEDLIPPPSPAGRPEPDRPRPPAPRAQSGRRRGEPVRAAAAERRGRAPAAAAARPGRVALPPALRLRARRADRRRPGRDRLGVALAAPARDDGVPRGWSAWQPSTDDDAAAAKQIAEHVGPKYRLGDGDQLVAVQAGALEIADLPLSVALRTAADGGDIELIEGNGVMYTLNGLGPHGSIPGGKPSEERHLLLRREALELALYTFRYADDVDMVVTLLPPPPPEKGAAAAHTRCRRCRRCSSGRATSGRARRAARDDDPAATPRPETMKLAGPKRSGSTRSRARTCSRRRSSRARTRAFPGARPPADGLSVLGAGLCASCRHQSSSATHAARRSRSACARGPIPRYPKYPRLPVLACRGHEPVRPGDGPAGPAPRGAA